jgi:hypothetical protein
LGRFHSTLLAFLIACGGRTDLSSSPSDAATIDAPTLPADVTSFPEADVVDPATTDASTPGPSPPDATVVLDAGGQDGLANDSALEAAPPLECDSGAPVEVCVQYYEFLSMCIHENLVDDACLPSLIPHNAIELAQIQMLCAVNLQRIQQACR